MRVWFKVLGEPKGKGRPRVSVRNGFAKAYTPKDTVTYENLVKLEYQLQCSVSNVEVKRFPDDAYIHLNIVMYYAIPKSTSKKKREQMLRGEIRPIKKPDVDNCVKIIADSLNGIAYRDDSQVVDCSVRKFYSDEPRVEVTIEDEDYGEYVHCP